MQALPEDVVRLVYTHYKVQITLLLIAMVYTSTRCLAPDIAHYLHHFERLVVYNIDS